MPLKIILFVPAQNYYTGCKFFNFMAILYPYQSRIIPVNKADSFLSPLGTHFISQHLTGPQVIIEKEVNPRFSDLDTKIKQIYFPFKG